MLDARRKACLAAMGIELWRARADGEGNRPGGRGPGAGEERNEERGSRFEESESRDTVPATSPIGDSSPATEPASASAPGPRPAALAEGPPPSALALGPGPSALSWDQLRTAVQTCTACSLHETRTQTVFGVGDPNSSLMVIGEAPGADEDRQGEPFVGRAGQLLNAMLEAIGFAREQVYIANIIKCRPPGNRDPHIEETAACQPYLHRQIALLQPRLILSVGRISAHNLLGTEEAVGRLRGRVHRFDPGDIPLIVTYHPAYLLRRPQEKAKAWQDLQAAYHILSDSLD